MIQKTCGTCADHTCQFNGYCKRLKAQGIPAASGACGFWRKGEK